MPIATIKFYTRENLIPGGEKTSPKQATYSDAHLSRLRLIRALVEVGGLSIAKVGEALAAIDDEALPIGDAIGAAAQALPAPAGPRGETTAGELAIAELLRARAWQVSPDNAGRALAARVLDEYLALDRADLTASLEEYADAAERIAAVDLDAVARAGSRAAMAETVIVGTVLGDALLAGLRRMAHEDAAVRRFPATRPASTPAAGKDSAS